MPFSRESIRPRDRARVSCIAGRFFTAEPPGKSRCICSFIKKLPELSKPIIPFYSPINPRSTSSSKVVSVILILAIQMGVHSVSCSFDLRFPDD